MFPNSLAMVTIKNTQISTRHSHTAISALISHWTEKQFLKCLIVCKVITFVSQLIFHWTHKLLHSLTVCFDFAVSQARTALGSQAFPVVGHWPWHSLSVSVLYADFMMSLRSGLKPYPFIDCSSSAACPVSGASQISTGFIQWINTLEWCFALRRPLINALHIIVTICLHVWLVLSWNLANNSDEKE